MKNYKYYLLVFVSAVHLTANAHPILDVRDGIPHSPLSIKPFSLAKKLTHSIDGYEVNCARRLITLWGKPKKMNASDPQSSEITIVDLHNRRIIAKSGLSGGIFRVRYLSNQVEIYIEKNTEVTLNFRTGVFTILPPNVDALQELSLERCNNFKGKSYLKYAQ